MARRRTVFMCGAGESGKSTVVKQMRLRYDRPWSDHERLEHRSIVHANVVQSLKVCLEAVPEFDLVMHEPGAPRWVSAVQEASDMDELDEELADALRHLWRTQAIQYCIEHRSQIQLNDSVIYYMKNIERITAPNFMPNDQDILHSRVRSTGIIQHEFKVGDFIYRVIDVGGQRSERRKWMNVLEGVDVLLYLFATSEFDQQLFEDETTNRFTEAIQLWSSIANSLWFRTATIVLFLNKVDLLADKLARGIQLQDYLPDYSGRNTPAEALKHMRRYLLDQFKDPSREVYVHETCATDTKSLSVILASLQDQILRTRLDNSYIM